jgi:hypothetical protein
MLGIGVLKSQKPNKISMFRELDIQWSKFRIMF